ncbi:ATP-dependent DNA ligase [Paraphysoderma sedebokerense]|nr:ATP-dependent DNA ligase [Paraphysoderma sedebokerense]
MSLSTNKGTSSDFAQYQQSFVDIFTHDPSILPPEFENGKIPYSFLVSAFKVVDSTKSRNSIVDTLTNMFRTIIYHSPDDLLPALWLSSNSIAPQHEGIEMGIGGSIMTKAIVNVTGRTAAALRADYERLGDLGDVAFESKSKVRTLFQPLKKLTLEGVFKTLHQIAGAKGSGSSSIKQDLVQKLLVSCRPDEIRYLTRTLISNLRIGAVKTSMLIALSRAAMMTQPGKHILVQPKLPWKQKEKDSVKEKLKTAEGILKQCYAQVPDYNIIVPYLLQPNIGVEHLLQYCSVTPGTPIKPMLGKITRNLEEVFSKLKDRSFVCDVKYDGMRSQIHKLENGKVALFSRHLENITSAYPDVSAAILQSLSLNTSSLILDAEIVAISPINGDIQTFQTLASRGRKNVTLENIKVPVKVLIFDIMYHNGISLLQLPLKKRREVLKEAINVNPGSVEFVETLVVDAMVANGMTEEERESTVQEFLKKAIDGGSEGLMIKVWEQENKPGDSEGNSRSGILCTYEPDKRTESWLKVKKDYLDGIVDSIDAVPIGAWYGNGRKAGWYSPFLLAVYNPQTESYETLTKVLSGFSDSFYKEKLEFYSADSNRLIPGPLNSYNVSSSLIPDVWFKPSEIWEIKGSEFTISSMHTCGREEIRVGGDNGKGLSLRFPRFIRVREDKFAEGWDGIEGVNTTDDVVEMFLKQGRKVEGDDRMEEGDDSEGE